MKLSKLSLVLILVALGLALSEPNLKANGSESTEPAKSNQPNFASSENPSPRLTKNSQQQQSHPAKTNKQTARDPQGTDKKPFVVKSLEAEKTPERVEQDRAEREEKAANEGRLITWTIVLAITSVVLTLVAGAQLCMFWLQLGYIRKSLTTAQEASNAAAVGASATRDSADTAKLSMVASERAYVHFNGCRWISHADINDGHIFWRIRARWMNSGNTPTRGLRIYVHFDLRDDELPQDYKFIPDQTVKPGPVTISPKGVIESGGWDITGTDLVDISQAKKHLYIWGRAVYRDVFPGTKEHITKFCVFATNLTGDPLRPWHADKNPFDIAFAVYRQHNCTDEDCDAEE